MLVIEALLPRTISLGLRHQGWLRSSNFVHKDRPPCHFLRQAHIEAPTLSQAPTNCISPIVGTFLRCAATYQSEKERYVLASKMRPYGAKKCPPESRRAAGGVATGQYPEAEIKDSDPRATSELV